MKNPCDECLVKVCCTEQCNEKEVYTEWSIRCLEKICMKVYSRNGNRRKHIKKELWKQHEMCADRCEKNTQENQNIFKRILGHDVFSD